MTKEEKIKEAYKELGINFHENVLYDKGWMRISPSQYSSKYDKLDLLKLTDHTHSIRPKSLQGIENNNGWIKIESEDDLPKESGLYDFQVYPQRSYRPNNLYWHKGATKIGWYIETYTHYQKTEIRKPPLY